MFCCCVPFPPSIFTPPSHVITSVFILPFHQQQLIIDLRCRALWLSAFLCTFAIGAKLLWDDVLCLQARGDCSVLLHCECLHSPLFHLMFPGSPFYWPPKLHVVTNFFHPWLIDLHLNLFEGLHLHPGSSQARKYQSRIAPLHELVASIE